MSFVEFKITETDNVSPLTFLHFRAAFLNDLWVALFSSEALVVRPFKRVISLFWLRVQ